ncbi:MAG: hypothetical protein PUC00_11045 [Clostridiales bacterium]|nr:hypothetical protein [Clostridiales bacterium]
MLKLLKYEFRKCRTMLLALLGITAVLEGYYLVALRLVTTRNDYEEHLIIAIGLLVLTTYAVAIFVFVKGITSYSSELKDKSAYLIFMTPNSGLQIMGSKFLFTFLIGLSFSILYVALGVGDFTYLLREIGELESFMQSLRQALMSLGISVHFDQMALAVAAVGLYIMLSVLSVVALAYLAITLSHTLFRDKKWRGFVALLLFIALNWLVSRLYSLFPSVTENMVYVETVFTRQMSGDSSVQSILTFSDVLRSMLPQAGVSLGVILVSLFGCAWMLDRKVSL